RRLPHQLRQLQQPRPQQPPPRRRHAREDVHRHRGHNQLEHHARRVVLVSRSVHHRELIWLFLAALSLWPQSDATAVRAEGGIRRFRALAVYAPRPPYPYEARARREQGSGLAVLTVDPATGNVTNVVMRASTGVGILDEVTVSTFSQWR